MKQIIIFLLLVIICIMGYNLYNKHQRFALKNYSYTPLETISVTNTNRSDVLNYHKAIEALNGYVITQWSANSIDVRNPENDDEVTKAAVAEYGTKLANVKYYETLLLNIKTAPKTVNKIGKHNKLLKELLSDFDALKIGKSNAAVYELQKILNNKGYKIPIDGYYKDITAKALSEFEQKHSLYPDGKMDLLTLEALLD